MHRTGNAADRPLLRRVARRCGRPSVRLPPRAGASPAPVSASTRQGACRDVFLFPPAPGLQRRGAGGRSIPFLADALAEDPAGPLRGVRATCGRRGFPLRMQAVPPQRASSCLYPRDMPGVWRRCRRRPKKILKNRRQWFIGAPFRREQGGSCILPLGLPGPKPPEDPAAQERPAGRRAGRAMARESPRKWYGPSAAVRR